MCMHHFTAVVKYKDLKFVLEYIWARTPSLKGSDQAKFAYSNPRTWHWQFHLLWTISIHYFDRDANRSSRQTRQASLPLVGFWLWPSHCGAFCSSPEHPTRSSDGRRGQPLKCSGLKSQHTEEWGGRRWRGWGADGWCFPPCFLPKRLQSTVKSLCSYMIVYITFITTQCNNCKSITSITNDNFLLYLSISITPLRGISGNFGPVNQATLKVIAKSHS